MYLLVGCCPVSAGHLARPERQLGSTKSSRVVFVLAVIQSYIMRRPYAWNFCGVHHAGQRRSGCGDLLVAAAVPAMMRSASENNSFIP
jgi:hypothetical protein